MKTPFIFKASLLATTGACALPQLLLAQQSPHIILIMSDQHRADAINCMGNPSVISPHLDALAQDGTLFMNGYSSTPSSTPARAGLLTGLSPWHHGMLGYYAKVAEQYRYEMPRMLSDLNYYSYGVGKMHWYPQKALHGFKATFVDESGRVESPDFISDYRLWLQLQAPGLDPDATGIGWNDHGHGTYKLPKPLHPTAWTGETACDLIRNYEVSDHPLFLKVSFARPHSPYDPPKLLLNEYEDRDIPAPCIGEWCKDKEYAQLKDPQKAKPDAPYGNFGEEYAKESRRHYYANVTFIDEEIGKIIRTLKQKGMYENALICYVSDHGDMLGDHHHWRKTYPYEGSTHIPYIVKWPSSYAFEKGKHLTQPVELRDLLPTFLEAAGSTTPEDMDGKSLFSLMKGETSGWRKYIDLEHATAYSEDNYWCGLTDGKMKYIWNLYNGTEELFDLVKDRQELKNVATDKKYKRTLEEMRQAMADHLAERGEQFVKNGKLQTLKQTILISPQYPK